MGGGGAAHYLATGATTGGAFGLYRWDMGPAPSGPSPHFHRSITESFFVLSGTVRLHDGQQWRRRRPGRLHPRADRRRPRLPERVGGAGVDAAAVHAGCAAGGLLRDARRRRPPRAMGQDDWTAFFLRHDTFWVDRA